MRFLVVCRNGHAFLTAWNIFPDWDKKEDDAIVSIIDTKNALYVNKEHWRDENEEPEWQRIEEDHL